MTSIHSKLSSRKQIPILVGKTMDIYQELNPVAKSLAIFTIMLWKLYMAYYLYYGCSSLSSSFGSVNMNVHDKVLHAVATITANVSTHHTSNASSGHSNKHWFTNPIRSVMDNTHSDKDVEKMMKSQSVEGDIVQDPKHPALGLVPRHTSEKPLRVLHIVTALAEYNNGSRGTVHGEDRLQKVFIPVLQNSVQSMISDPYNYQVDVFLVLGWKLLPERRKLIEDALPEGVGLQVWDDATPLGYDRPKTDVKLKHVTRGLARQHRFVIKDKLMYYDLFTVFEDDMRITGGHIHQFLELSRELERLVEEAPDVLSDEDDYPKDQDSISRQLSKKQLKRMMPGFIRAEVLLDESKYPSQKELDPIPVDLQFKLEDGTVEEMMFDPKPCCHVPPNLGKMPPEPRGDQIMIWETAVKGTVVRKMPEGGTGLLDWVMLQPGPKNLKKDEYIGGYWSGNLGLYGKEEKPGAGDPRLIAQQGGWMATRAQLIEMHLHQCPSGFFPPYENDGFHQDGLTLNNVEFWSGGFSVFSGTKSGCNMQRIISLKPEHFSQHFLYHTANNKQKSLPNFRLLKANNFMGQINSVVKAAKKELLK
mmetsp:Transcript_13144/g.24707  ORF Transcript_13144/g.24707 Transcript_13144/m.24707 type:complete len:588 (+) Transcript_13144:195-1958(+)